MKTLFATLAVAALVAFGSGAAFADDGPGRGHGGHGPGASAHAPGHLNPGFSYVDHGRNYGYRPYSYYRSPGYSFYGNYYRPFGYDRYSRYYGSPYNPYVGSPYYYYRSPSYYGGYGYRGYSSWGRPYSSYSYPFRGYSSFSFSF